MSDSHTDNDDETSSIDTETLDKYTPSEEAVMGTVEEQEQSGDRSTEIVSGVPPRIPLDFTPSSTAKDDESVLSDMNTNERHVPSSRQTTFDPSEGADHVDYHRLNEIDHSTGDNEKAAKRRQERVEDIDILTNRFDLTDQEQWFITTVNDNTDLKEHGSAKYETLLLAALRYVFRANRNWALRRNSVGTHDEYADVYASIRQSWNCDTSTVETLYGYVGDNFDNCL